MVSSPFFCYHPDLHWPWRPNTFFTHLRRHKISVCLPKWKSWIEFEYENWATVCLSLSRQNSRKQIPCFSERTSFSTKILWPQSNTSSISSPPLCCASPAVETGTSRWRPKLNRITGPILQRIYWSNFICSFGKPGFRSWEFTPQSKLEVHLRFLLLFYSSLYCFWNFLWCWKRRKLL